MLALAQINVGLNRGEDQNINAAFIHVKRFRAEQNQDSPFKAKKKLFCAIFH